MDLVLAKCARNSARTSAAINLLTLFFLGYFGLKIIYKDEYKKNVFRILITLFAVNHLIHFFFVSQLYDLRLMQVEISHNLHGFITYLSILLLPLILWVFKNLNRLLYTIILLHIFNVTYFICISFYGRYKPIDPAYLHRLGILIMIGTVIYILYRVYRERMISFKDITTPILK